MRGRPHSKSMALVGGADVRWGLVAPRVEGCAASLRAIPCAGLLSQGEAV